jgi:hypothetical protein
VNEAVAKPGKRPWQLWVVGALATLWNAGGVFSWFTIVSGNYEGMGFTPEMVAYLEAYPVWAMVAYTMGTWGAFLGSLALLLRSRWATLLFGVAIIGLAGTTIHERVLSDLPQSFRSGGQMVFTIVIWATTIALLLYSRFLASRGILR